jgi:two-component system, NtrC family, response regulator HydG
MANHKTLRILVVDDEPDTCANLSDILTEQGYRVDVAHDGLAALELVKKNAYDVALLDLKMPGIDGLELYRRIRTISADTVAIVVTAYASSTTATSVLGAGAWKILSKPVNLPQLLGFVGQAISQPLVLVVDDDRELCDTLWELFRDRQYRVCLAHDVPEAQGRLEQRDFHVVVVDMKLPSGDGTAVLDCVRRANPEARSVVITGFRGEMEQRVQTALAGGANAVCYKPFQVNELLKTVGKLCEEHKKE